MEVDTFREKGASFEIPFIKINFLAKKGKTKPMPF